MPGFRRRKLLTQVGRQSLSRALIYVGFGAPSLDKRCFLRSIRVLFEFGAMSEVDVTTQLTAQLTARGRGIVHVVRDIPDRRQELGLTC